MYEIAVEVEGVNPALRAEVEIHASDRIRLNFALETENVVEVVEITGTTPLLETELATLGYTVERQQTEDLPMSSRDCQSLARLTGGEVAETRRTAVTERGAWRSRRLIQGSCGERRETWKPGSSASSAKEGPPHEMRSPGVDVVLASFCGSNRPRRRPNRSRTKALAYRLGRPLCPALSDASATQIGSCSGAQ